MSDEFTPEEIEEAARAARIYSPGFTREQFLSLVELEKHLQDSGYLESVRSLARLEREEGISYSEARDRYKEQLRQNQELEGRVAQRRADLETLEEKIAQEQQAYQRTKESREQTERELQAAQAELRKQQQELIILRGESKQEKQDIEEELAGCRERANVAKEDIAAACSLKEQLASRGFTLQLVLDISQEFAGHESARSELGKAIAEHGTLSKSHTALVAQNEVQQSLLVAAQTRVRSLEEARHQMEDTISQLRTNAAEEEELRRFYRRYQGVGVLMDYLASWDIVYFVRCNNAVAALASVFDRSAACARFWTNKPAARCPHCGLTMVSYDEQLYRAVNLPIGTPFKLQLGE